MMEHDCKTESQSKIDQIIDSQSNTRERLETLLKRVDDLIERLNGPKNMTATTGGAFPMAVSISISTGRLGTSLDHATKAANATDRLHDSFSELERLL